MKRSKTFHHLDYFPTGSIINTHVVKSLEFKPISLLVHYNTPSKISFLLKTAREYLAKSNYHFYAKIDTTSIRTSL